MEKGKKLQAVDDSMYAPDILSLNPTSEDLEKKLNEIEGNMPFVAGIDFSNLFSFVDNLEEPIHRWFYYKEGFSHKLLSTLLERYQIKEGCVLDPFCGAGTTLLAAQSMGLNAIGIEVNPFAVFLSSVKCNWHQINEEVFAQSIKDVISGKQRVKVVIPELTTFHNKRFFPDKQVYRLFRLKTKIQLLDIDQVTKNALLLALASSIEDISYLHKDGRLSRYMKREIVLPEIAFEKNANQMLEDIKSLKQIKSSSGITIIEGDARQIETSLESSGINCSIELILYSPPYLNNFDYSEIYKCELWLLGFIQNYEQWRQLRLKTLRSHPSCKFPKTSYLHDNTNFREVHRLVEQYARCSDIGGRAQKDAPATIRGYFDDVAVMLQKQAKVIAPGGYVICIVGNSMHGNLHIHADTLIGKIGDALGLELIEIYIGRYKSGRRQGNSKLRESLVVFRKR